MLAPHSKAIQGASSSQVVPKPAGTRIGLALGGGSARGWAHIGVIQELAAHGIVVDVIAGTSIGAIVGACAAAGKLDRLADFACGLNRRRVFGLMDLSLGGTGLISGARLQRRLARDLDGLAIESLPIPFAAIATELGSGIEVCLSRGDLNEAIRASYALPGIFEPLRVGGRWLFDGAMSNPVPVSVCRRLGADFVIAVNLTADFAERSYTTHAEPLDEDVSMEAREMRAPKRRFQRIRRRIFARRRLFGRRADGAPGIASVMVGAFSIAQERISRSRLAMDPPDVLINARLTSVGLFDFHRAVEIIAHGRRVARDAIPEIEAGLMAAGRALERV